MLLRNNPLEFKKMSAFWVLGIVVPIWLVLVEVPYFHLQKDGMGGMRE